MIPTNEIDGINDPNGLIGSISRLSRMSRVSRLLNEPDKPVEQVNSETTYAQFIFGWLLEKGALHASGKSSRIRLEIDRGGGYNVNLTKV